MTAPAHNHCHAHRPQHPEAAAAPAAATVLCVLRWKQFKKRGMTPHRGLVSAVVVVISLANVGGMARRLVMAQAGVLAADQDSGEQPPGHER